MCFVVTYTRRASSRAVSTTLEVHVSPTMKERDFKLFSQQYDDKICEYLITKDKLLEPRFEYPYKRQTGYGIKYSTAGETSFGFKNSATGVRK